MVNLTIDDKQITVEKGTTILKAAGAAGIRIPNLCYLEKLRPFGACRLCVVEIEKKRGFSTACSTPVRDGMVVRTNTPAVQKARRTVLELLLVHHPLDCEFCDKAGECELQDAVFEIGPTENRFRAERFSRPSENSNPFIERNTNRCTLCGRCVRICSDIQGVGAIDFTKRGFGTVVGPAFGNPLDCEFCGNCLSGCKVGALNDKLFLYSARGWELDKVETICPYCGCGCTILLNSKGDRIYRVTADENLGNNEGLLCVKGRFGFDFVHNKDRLSSPLIKKEGRFVEVSWEEALSFAAERLAAARKEWGGGAVAALGSARLCNEDNYLLQKFVRTVLGSNNLDSSYSADYAAVNSALREGLGLSAATSSYSEIVRSSALLVLGTDVSESLPVVGLKIQEAVNKNGAKLIVLHPYRTKLSKFAYNWLPTPPGSEGEVLDRVMKVMVEKGWVDEEYLNQQTENYAELVTYLSAIGDREEIAGTTRSQIKETAELLAKEEGLSIFLGAGADSCLSEAAVNLFLLTGCPGRPRSGIFPLLERNNLQGLWDMGVTPDYLPGYRKAEERGLSFKEMASAIERGELKVMYVVGDNPARLPEMAEALAKLKLLVVQDVFLTETAQLADVVFPATTFAEKEGSFTNGERRVQMVRPALSAYGGSKPDWWVIVSLARKMGADFNYQTSGEVMEEIAREVSIYKGITHQRLETGVQWPADSEIPFVSKGRFLLSSGSPGVWKRKGDSLKLVVGSFLFRSGSTSERTGVLSQVHSEVKLELNRDDAERLGLTEGSWARVRSSWGEARIRVKTSERMARGVAYLPVHSKEAGMLVEPGARLVDVKIERTE